MNAKEYLSQAFHIDQRINSKLEQVMKLRETSTKATATLSDMPRSDSPNVHRLEDTICKIIDLENEINHDIDRLVDLKREARDVIGQLSDPDQQLILEIPMTVLKHSRWRLSQKGGVSIGYERQKAAAHGYQGTGGQPWQGTPPNE